LQDFPVIPPISLDTATERIKDFCNSQLPAEEFAEASCFSSSTFNR
jgi:hypothetical protein